jgi:hypothetical protein
VAVTSCAFIVSQSFQATALGDGFRITAAIRERVDGATTFAVNASGLGFSALLEKVDGADHLLQ